MQPAPVGGDDGVHRGPEHGAEAPLVFLQRLLDADAIGDVLREDHDAADATRPLHPGANLPAQPLADAVRPHELVLFASRALAGLRAAMDFLPLLRHLREDVVMRLADDIAIEIEILAPAGAHGDIAHLPVKHGHGRRRLLDEMAELLGVDPGQVVAVAQHPRQIGRQPRQGDINRRIDQEIDNNPKIVRIALPGERAALQSGKSEQEDQRDGGDAAGRAAEQSRNENGGIKEIMSGKIVEDARKQDARQHRSRDDNGADRHAAPERRARQRHPEIQRALGDPRRRARKAVLAPFVHAAPSGPRFPASPAAD